MHMAAMHGHEQCVKVRNIDCIFNYNHLKTYNLDREVLFYLPDLIHFRFFNASVSLFLKTCLKENGRNKGNKKWENDQTNLILKMWLKTAQQLSESIYILSVAQREVVK